MGAATGITEVALHLQNMQTPLGKQLFGQMRCFSRDGVICRAIVDDENKIRKVGLLRQTMQASKCSLPAAEVCEESADGWHAGIMPDCKTIGKFFCPIQDKKALTNNLHVVYTWYMNLRLTWLSVVAAVLASCAGPSDSVITDIADLPIKSTIAPPLNWQNSPLRANALYVFYDAKVHSERNDMVGDYYYVNWYDAHPESPVRLVMRYTQAGTGNVVKMREVTLPAGRGSAGNRKTQFFFAGEERRRLGDVMSWRMELYVGGKLKDAKQSYLWH